LRKVRGGEAFDLVQALNTGHGGTLSTIRANSAPQALARLGSCVMQRGIDVPYQAVRQQIGDSIHLVRHLERSQGRRTVTEFLRIEQHDPQLDKYDTELVQN
jgi:pilus assembly protein CpaF